MMRIYKKWSLLLIIVLFISCNKSETSIPLTRGLKVNISQGIDVSSQDVIDNMRLMTFHTDSKVYEQELLNIERAENTLSCSIKEGKWHMTMVSAPTGYDISRGNESYEASNLLLYEYNPLTVDGRSENAIELFTSFVDVPKIKASETQTISTTIVRNVAKVEVLVNDISGDIDLESTSNRVYIHNVPNKISYTGMFLPSVSNPDTLSTPIHSSLTLSNIDGKTKAEKIAFIIPANKGDIDGVASQHKMSISIELVKRDGSVFKATREIPLVARCNEVLRINLVVNTGVDIEASIHPWIEEEHDVSLPQTDLVVDKSRVEMSHIEKLHINSNESVVLSTEETDSWLNVTLSSENLIDLVANVDTYTQIRTTSFTIKTGRVNKVIKVTQQPIENGDISIDRSIVIVSPANLTKSIEVVSSARWKILSPLTKVTANITEGTSGTSTLSFTRKGNTYHGDEICVIRNMETLEEVEIDISNLYFTDLDIIEFGKNGGSQILPIESYGGRAYVRATTTTPWITVSNDSNKDLKVDVPVGPDEEGDRYGSILVHHIDDIQYTKSIKIKQKENIIVTIPEFDYLTFRYYWTSDDGRDLDTATELINTGLRDQYGRSIDNMPVGWNLKGNGSAVTKYLKWGGDNTQSGNESTFIDMGALVSTVNYPLLPRFIEARIYAAWYATKRNGNITFEIVAYKGGRMQQDGFNYINVGGAVVYKELHYKHVPAKGGSTNATNYKTRYTYVSKITYDKIKHSAQVEIIPDTKNIQVYEFRGDIKKK